MPLSIPAATRHPVASDSYDVPGAAQAVLGLLEHIHTGELLLRDPLGAVHHFGRTGELPYGSIRVHRWEFFPRILAERSLGLGESYMDGWWDAEGDDIASAVGVLLLNDIRSLVRLRPGFVLRMIAEVLRHHPRLLGHSRGNVRHHYDLSNSFYRMMLGRSMAYSCGILDDTFPLHHAANSLDAMQDRKHDLVCRKLHLQSGETLLDIGCGWGGLLFHAARNYGARATGVTLSSAQAQWIADRTEKEGLHDRIHVECRDYRETEGSFDAVASIGMFEHVGTAQYGVFMRTVRRLLPHHGRFLLHTIGTRERALRNTFDPWIERYIFPGGHLPSLDQIISAVQREQFTIGHIENFKPHYARTLRLWKNNVDGQRSAIGDLSPRFDERFFRMWDFYLQSCEAAFRYGVLELYHVLCSKGDQWMFPLQFRY